MFFTIALIQMLFDSSGYYVNETMEDICIAMNLR